VSLVPNMARPETLTRTPLHRRHASTPCRLLTPNGQLLTAPRLQAFCDQHIHHAVQLRTTCLCLSAVMMQQSADLCRIPGSWRVHPRMLTCEPGVLLGAGRAPPCVLHCCSIKGLAHCLVLCESCSELPPAIVHSTLHLQSPSPSVVLCPGQSCQ